MSGKLSAKERYFQYLESKGILQKKKVSEIDDHSDLEEMPEMHEAYAYGGMVEEENDEPDYAYELQMEDEEFGDPDPGSPKKFLRMARGGKVPSPHFVKAIRKAMY